MLHRFFIPPDWLTPPTVELHGETARQIRTVLRLQSGDEIIALDNSGLAWSVRLTEVGKTRVYGEIVARRPARGEPAIDLTLYQGTLKGQKFEWALQKGTELGARRFVPTICQRSVVDKADALFKKQDRWRRIIQEAAEQSGRGKLPTLAKAVSFGDSLAQAKVQHDLVIMPWEAATDDLSLKTVLTERPVKSIAVFIGPEGGFSAEESALASEAGARLVTLGRRILRAETAGLVVCSAIFYELGEWEHRSNE